MSRFPPRLRNRVTNRRQYLDHIADRQLTHHTRHTRHFNHRALVSDTLCLVHPAVKLLQPRLAWRRGEERGAPQRMY